MAPKCGGALPWFHSEKAQKGKKTLFAFFASKAFLAQRAKTKVPLFGFVAILAQDSSVEVLPLSQNGRGAGQVLSQNGHRAARPRPPMDFPRARAPTQKHKQNKHTNTTRCHPVIVIVLISQRLFLVIVIVPSVPEKSTLLIPRSTETVPELGN